MLTIEKLSEVIDIGKRESKNFLTKPYVDIFHQKEKICPNFKKDESTYNQFYQGDNFIVMKKLLEEGYKGKIDLIYIDPPFFTKTKYKGKIFLYHDEEEDIIEHFAYDDTWEEGFFSYLKMLCTRLFLMKELLSEKGTLYVHLDYRTVHYIKIIMDQIFGGENFLNEIIWAYKSGGASKRYYSKKHDTILVYTKGKEYIFNPQKEKSYNRGFKPYKFKGVKEYKDELGWYTLVNLKDVWQIDMVGRTSKERVGYDTQKPEKLLERIILTSSDEDSLIADFFAGSGTTGVVAEKLNRRWIMSDIGSLSSLTIAKRLIENNSTPFYIYKPNIRDERAGKLYLNEIILENDNGIKCLKIELDRYEIDLNKINIKDKDRELINEILTKNSLSLLDFIGIDPNYKDNLPNLRWQYYRNNKRNLDSIIYIKIDKVKEDQKIFIRYVDVFGNDNFMIYKIKNGKVIRWE
ncbi:site-specific DNA-methyltransferase (adenine-specific) [Keratinibaculum paraultunense]|uniref:Site-specific DNA-methyltransferase (Adenine-specific) n=2 Tax=Keratinibaculum paraultunense TaxID=1278232 RepID=A0A4R3L2E5_9FIRM|nr:site-specific DNA-methyltransferase [Keratinibaculum paraultunense]QQY79000.1 site-specific DNA-methyltransferase [Keratinibaculum paraultunense]TCS90622.1 site-specific DNA-methyltransferase (adenine-specific) [Keratinibaculum paraultunense]